MFHIYWGLGKGKTSTLNGSAIRALGAGLRVGFYRFLKGRESHENNILEKMGISVHLFHFSSKFVIEMNEQEKKQTQAIIKQGIDDLIANKNNYDVILIDEFIDLAAKNVAMISEEQMVEVIQKLEPQTREILVSGHTHLPKIFALANLITYYDSQKHYFTQGVKARKGIEF